MIDARADLWALSALVVWLITGERADRIDVRSALDRAAMPDRLTLALLISLADDPAARHANVAEWLADIDEAAPPALPARRHPQPGRSVTWRRRARRGGTWRSVVGAVVLLVAGLSAGVLAAGWLEEGGGDDQRIEDLGNGRVRVLDRSGSASISITGPVEVTRGDEARLVASTSGVDHWVWMLPGGDVLTDEPEVRVRASSAGRAEVSLRARTGDGDDLVATHEMRIVDR